MNCVFALSEINYGKKDIKNLFFKTNSDIKVKLQLEEADIKTFNKTVKLLEDKKWVEALSWADSIKSENFKEAMVNYVLWKKYSNIDSRSVDNDFNDLLIFIKNNEYLPNIKDLKSKAEYMYLNNNVPYRFVEAYFEKIKPINTETVIQILKEKYNLTENKNNEILKDSIIKVFYNYDFDNKNLQNFLLYFSNYLTELNYSTKIEKLIWENKYTESDWLMKYLNTNNRILYSGIIEIGKNPKYINNILRSIPKELRNNELLLYNRFLYEHKNKNKKEAINILLNNFTKNSNPEKWWLYQSYYARELLKEKDYKKAYNILNNSMLKGFHKNYSELQWSKGWLELAYLERPKDAYKSFLNMYNNVGYPISKSRASYWVGRSLENEGNYKEAIKWYDIGSKFPLYFYGQLSFHAKNELLGIPALVSGNPLPHPVEFSEKEENLALSSNIVKIAYLMAKCNDNFEDYSNLFMTAINNAKTKGERSAIFEIIKDTEQEALITRMAKFLTYKNIYFVDNLFPILNIINLDNPNSHLIHAIIKQESGFHVSAESRVGATGFMQLMPATAEDVSKRMKIPYNETALKTNPLYNIMLGSYYINSLIKQFDGSSVLAIASYNAGPTSVRRWIKDFGDPREMKDIKAIIDWMELIGYSETRNYVQRVIENSVVYEYILEKNVNNLKIEKNENEIQKKRNN